MVLLNVIVVMAKVGGDAKNAMGQAIALIAMAKAVSLVRRVEEMVHAGNVRGKEKFGVQIATEKVYALIVKAKRK